MPTDPVTLILTSAVVSAIITSAINGILAWVNLTRTMGHQAAQTEKTIKQQAEQTRLTIEHQAEQTRLTLTAKEDETRLADARTLRDAKRERLRAVFTPVLASAWAMNDFTVEQSLGLTGEEDPAKTARLTKLMQQASAANDALVQLTLERDATEVREAFFALRRDFDNYRMARYMSDDPDDIDWNVVNACKLNVHNGLAKLEALARHHLHELDQPLPLPAE